MCEILHSVCLCERVEWDKVERGMEGIMSNRLSSGMLWVLLEVLQFTPQLMHFLAQSSFTNFICTVNYL